jgi:iron complex transport system ATP-binding protein
MELAPYLLTENLAVGYPAKKTENRLFEKLNLHLLPGQLVCFMGPNGIGKSSLIRTFTGLQKALEGKIIVNPGISGASTAQQIAVVLTDKVTAVNMTVDEVVAFGRYPYLGWNIQLKKSDRQIIDNAISAVHINHLSGRKLHELSDGQLQMVMIARALAQDTPIILLDEPTAHLDLNNRVEIMRLLRDLSRKTNKAILVSTHELDLALQLADVIWLSGRDKNIHTGIPEDLVLAGAFDAIFQFKGFDLKTGKVQHTITKKDPIQLSGTGYEYLWTKNAFERNGFEVTDKAGAHAIRVVKENNTIRWHLKKHGVDRQFDSIAALLNYV